MPTKTHKNKPKVNRMNELRRVKSQATPKQNFPIVQPKITIPGQQIELFAKGTNNYPGLALKQNNPIEYLKQKLKLQVAKNLKTRKYNKPKSAPKRGPGSRGKTNTIVFNMAEYLERLESGSLRG